jgi:ParB family chromosome partitioning protein
MQQKSTVQYCPADEIEVGDRLRKDLGDIGRLAESIKVCGIICPIGVTPDMVLIYGQRRLEAAKVAGLDLVPYTVIETPDDDLAYRSMEMLENTERKDFTIEEKVRIADRVDPKIHALKNKIRMARIRKDVDAVEESHRELAQVLSRDLDAMPAKRVILSDLVGLGEKSLQWAREVVHASDQAGTPILRSIVDEMNRTGSVKTAFDKYVATLPPAPFGDSPKSSTAFYENDEDEDEDDQDDEAVPQSASVGKAISDVIEESDEHAAAVKSKPAEKKPKPPKVEAPAAAEPSPQKATKPRGQTRTHRSVVFDEEALRQQKEAFVKKTLRGIDAKHQERAMQILTGGSTAELAASVQMSAEVTDAGNAMRRVEKMFEELPPDHQQQLCSLLVEFADKHKVEKSSSVPDDYLPKLPEDHEQALEQVSDEMRVRFRGLKDLEQWNFGSIVPQAVRSFMKTVRRRMLEFERHTSVGADPNKTLFEADADFPPHLATEEFQELWAEWWSERKRRKLSVTPGVKKKQLKLLGIGDVEQATMIVSKAIENTWQGIPDGIWEGTLWCDREPAHADEKLLKKIKATGPKPGSYKTKDEEMREQVKRRGRFVDDEE